jgi:hypothetical protein
MNITPVRRILLAGALCALAVNASAQVVELRATINQAQENPPTGAPGTGTAVMFYDVGTNTFDLMVTINGMTNMASASHIHEAAVGANGGVVTNLGGEAAYTRSGNTLTATFRDITHGGDARRLLRGEAYFNIHSAQFPGGEVRGQLIARPKRFYATIDVPQEAAAFPALNFAGLNDIGGAIMVYDPTTNMMRLRLSLFNFNNTFTNSHFHAEIPGRGGPVVVALGTNPNAGGYSNTNGFISGTFDIPMTGADPIALMLGGLYLNFHSNAFGGGEARGQVWPSEELPGSRFGNISVRGFVGTGDQVLIQGINISGPEPIRVLIAAKGPSLTPLGVAGALANPVLQLYDSGRRLIATNDNVGTIAAGSELAAIPGMPTNANESALVVVLPPGNYTAIVSAATGTGIALLEVTDLRSANPTLVPSAGRSDLVVQNDTIPGRTATISSVAARAAQELCAAVPLAISVASR